MYLWQSRERAQPLPGTVYRDNDSDFFFLWGWGAGRTLSPPWKVKFAQSWHSMAQRYQLLMAEDVTAHGQH